MLRNIAACSLLAVLVAGCAAEDRRTGGDPSADTAPLLGGTAETPAVLFLGTSLTAGLGLDPEQAYPALIQQKIDSADLDFRAINAGVSGETSAAGLRRIDWLLTQPVRVLVLELGANDALRGQDVAAAGRNLQAIIDRARARHPGVRIVIAGMEAPPNLGDRYTRAFRDMFVQLARENDAALIPFLLAGVAGVPELNQADGIHPNAAGTRIVAENVWRVLREVLVAAAQAD
jgi:acyl-CoA thioesterase-1